MNLIVCYVLLGPVAIGLNLYANEGDLIELFQADYDQLIRWGIVREATAEEIANSPILTPTAVAEARSASTSAEGSPTETAAQKKKRLSEEKAAQDEADRIAAEEAGV